MECRPTDHTPIQDQISPTANPEESTKEGESSPILKPEKEDEHKSSSESKNSNSDPPTFQSPPTKCSDDTCNLPYQSHSPYSCGGTHSGPNKITLGFFLPANYRPIRVPTLLTPPNTEPVISATVPQVIKVPPLSPPYAFKVPVKRISSPADIKHFNTFDSGKTFLGFVVLLSEAIRRRFAVKLSLRLKELVKFLVKRQKWLQNSMFLGLGLLLVLVMALALIRSHIAEGKKLLGKQK